MTTILEKLWDDFEKTLERKDYVAAQDLIDTTRPLSPIAAETMEARMPITHEPNQD